MVRIAFEKIVKGIREVKGEGTNIFQMIIEDVLGQMMDTTFRNASIVARTERSSAEHRS